MKEYKVSIPEGWFLKVALMISVIAAVLTIWPYYSVYLDYISTKTIVEKARAQAEAKRILGDACQ